MKDDSRENFAAQIQSSQEHIRLPTTFIPQRGPSFCVSNESAYYNNERETALQNDCETSQVILQSEGNLELDYERGQQIPGFSFFGKVDYMNNNAGLKKSVSSVAQLQKALGQRRVEDSPTRKHDDSASVTSSTQSLPRFAGSEEKNFEGGLKFLNDPRKSQ